VARALTEAGLATTASALFGSYACLTGSRFPPTAAQAWAEDASLPEGPLLVVLEDITGSGKTEAGLVFPAGVGMN
jgi:CRISPR-associated endonuclease/helicase Cas3